MCRHPCRLLVACLLISACASAVPVHNLSSFTSIDEVEPASWDELPTGHRTFIKHLTLTPDGRYAVSGANSNFAWWPDEIIWWDAVSLREVGRLDVRQEERVGAVLGADQQPLAAVWSESHGTYVISRHVDGAWQPVIGGLSNEPFAALAQAYDGTVLLAREDGTAALLGADGVVADVAGFGSSRGLSVTVAGDRWVQLDEPFDGNIDTFPAVTKPALRHRARDRRDVSILPLTKSPLRLAGAARSPVVAMSYAKAVEVHWLDGSRRPLRIATEWPGLPIALSPDGKRLALSDSERSGLYDLTSGAFTWHEHLAGAQALTFTPDGAGVIVSDNRRLMRIDLASKVPVVLGPESARSVDHLSFAAPDVLIMGSDLGHGTFLIGRGQEGIAGYRIPCTAPCSYDPERRLVAGGGGVARIASPEKSIGRFEALEIKGATMSLGPSGIWAVSEHGLSSIDPVTLSVTQRLKPEAVAGRLKPYGGLGELSLSPDERLVAVLRADGPTLFRLGSGTDATLLHTDWSRWSGKKKFDRLVFESSDHAVAWTDYGDSLAGITIGQSEVAVIPLPLPVSTVVSAALPLDGHRTLIGTARGEVIEVDAIGASQLRARVGDGPIHALAREPTRGVVAAAGHDGIVRFWSSSFEPLGALASFGKDVRMWDAHARPLRDALPWVPAVRETAPTRPVLPLINMAVASPSSLVLSPDRMHAAVMGHNNDLVVWNTALGLQMFRFKVGIGSSAVFDADGRLWFSGYEGLQFYDPKTHAVTLDDLGDPGFGSSLVGVADGRVLAWPTSTTRCGSGRDDGCIVFADPRTRVSTHLTMPDLSRGPWVVDPAGERVAIAINYPEPYVELWDRQKRKRLWRGRPQNEPAKRLLIHPARPVVVIVSAAHVTVFDYEREKVMWSFALQSFNPWGHWASLSADGGKLVIADSRMLLFDADGRKAARIIGPKEREDAGFSGLSSSACCGALDPRAGILWEVAAHASSGDLIQWDLDTGVELARLETRSVEPRVVDAEDGRFLVKAGLADWLFEPTEASHPAVLPSSFVSGRRFGHGDVILSQIGREVIVEEASSRVVVRRVRVPDSVSWMRLAFARSGRSALGWFEDGSRLSRFDIETASTSLLPGPGARVRDVAMAPNERWAVLILESEVVALDTKTGKPLVRAPFMSQSVPRFFPSGTRALFAAHTAYGDGALVALDTDGTFEVLIRGVRASTLALSADGRIAYIGANGSLVAMELATTKVLWSLSLDGLNELKSLECTGERCLFAGDDGMLRLVEAEHGNLIATIVLFKGGRSAVILPNGHYAASRGLGRDLGLRTSQGVLSFQDVDATWNRPDEVAKALGAPAEQVRALADLRERRLRRGYVAPAGDPPTVAATWPFRVDVAEATISADVGGDGTLFPVTVTAYVNGTPTSTRAERAGKVSFKVMAATGANAVRVVATSAKGAVSRAVEGNIVRAGKATSRFHLLTIGVTSYQDPAYDNLKFARADAEALDRRLGEVWAKQGIVPAVTSLVDEEATRKNVLAALDTLAKTAPDDVVVVTFAGHGVVFDGTYVLATHDIQDGKADSGVTIEELEQRLAAIPAHNKLVLLDACHAGELDKGDAPQRGSNAAIRTRGRRTAMNASSRKTVTPNARLVELAFDDLRDASGAQIVAGTTGQDFAFEGESWGHGVFTWSILELLADWRKADRNGNNRLETSELVEWVSQEVARATDGRQVPVARRENARRDFVLVAAP